MTNNYIPVRIAGVGYSLPEAVITNDDLTKLYDTSDEWIMSRVGIKTRRILKEDGLGTSYMGEAAVKKLLEATGTKPEDVDMLVCATVTPDMLFPATANIICDKCGILNAWGYDINAGCSGFIFTFETVRTFIESGRYKKVVLVCGERMSGIVDYTDRTTCPLFGDGAVAMLVEPTDDLNLGFQDSILHVDGVGRHYLYMEAGGSMYPATEETVKKADVSAEMMERHNLTADDIAYLIPHQANLRIIDATGRRMGLTPEKILIDIEKFGNTAGTSIPLALWDFKDKFKKGDTLIFSAFGAGFTWGTILYRWGY